MCVYKHTAYLLMAPGRAGKWGKSRLRTRFTKPAKVTNEVRNGLLRQMGGQRLGRGSRTCVFQFPRHDSRSIKSCNEGS